MWVTSLVVLVSNFMLEAEVWKAEPIQREVRICAVNEVEVAVEFHPTHAACKERELKHERLARWNVVVGLDAVAVLDAVRVLVGLGKVHDGIHNCLHVSFTMTGDVLEVRPISQRSVFDRADAHCCGADSDTTNSGSCVAKVLLANSTSLTIPEVPCLVELEVPTLAGERDHEFL